MIEETRERINAHKLDIGPSKGRYESMPGDGTLHFVAALLSEQWQLNEDMSVDARTTMVEVGWAWGLFTESGEGDGHGLAASVSG